MAKKTKVPTETLDFGTAGKIKVVLVQGSLVPNSILPETVEVESGFVYGRYPFDVKDSKCFRYIVSMTGNGSRSDTNYINIGRHTTRACYVRNMRKTCTAKFKVVSGSVRAA